MKANPTGYESPAWWYDLRGFFVLKLAYRGSLFELIRFFSRNVSPKHLEVAIGSGTMFGLILKWLKFRRASIGQVTGFDYSGRMLEGAHRRFRKNQKIKLLHADVHHLPFPDGSFQTINVANAMHCFSEVNRALGEMFRVLEPGGRLATNVLTYPQGNRFQKWAAYRVNRWGAKKGILHSPYQKDDFINHAETAGFHVLEQRERGNALFLVLQKPGELSQAESIRPPAERSDWPKDQSGPLSR